MLGKQKILENMISQDQKINVQLMWALLDILNRNSVGIQIAVQSFYFRVLYI